MMTEKNQGGSGNDFIWQVIIEIVFLMVTFPIFPI